MWEEEVRKVDMKRARFTSSWVKYRELELEAASSCEVDGVKQ